MSTPEATYAPRWSPILSLLLLSLSLLSFGFALDRYPFFWNDEVQFNLPATRHLDGAGLNYKLYPSMPHGDWLWAAHSPFFPRLQILTFRVLGFSQFACRVLPFIAGYLGLAVLCLFLIHIGYWKTAVILPILWMGDRSLQELLAGRPDGLAILFLILSQISLFKLLQDPSFKWASLLAVCLGTAAGFHLVAFYFGCFSLLVIVLIVPRNIWRRIGIGLVCGGLLPLGLWLSCWWPHFAASWEQFCWFYQFVDWGDRNRNKLEIFPLIRWSKYWLIALLITTIFYLIPYTVRILLRRSRRQNLTRLDYLILPLTAFSCAFITLFVHKQLTLPNYILYFTIWPLTALLVLWEETPVSHFWRRSLPLIGAIVLFGWFPSAAWNAMRFRELILNYQHLNKAPFVNKLQNLVPATATIAAPTTSEQFILIQKAGRPYEPISAYLGRPAEIAATNWLLLSEVDLAKNLVSSNSLQGRRVALHEPAFPNATHPLMQWRYLLFAPSTVH